MVGQGSAALKTRRNEGSRMGGVRVGVDIGGTFTDLVAHDEQRKSWRVKVPTTYPDAAQGALEAVRTFLRDYHVDSKSVRLVIHATTLASNALLTGKLPRTGLVTREGFRERLELEQPSIWDITERGV